MTRPFLATDSEGKRSFGLSLPWLALLGLGLVLGLVRLVAALAAVVSRWRVELVCAGWLGLVFGLFSEALGRSAAVAACLLAAGGLAAWPPSREVIGEALAGALCRRRLRMACLAAGLVGEDGRAGWVRATRAVPVGTSMLMRIPVGSSVEAVDKAGPVLQAAMHARAVRIVADPARGHLVKITAVRRESLAGLTVPSVLPDVARAILAGTSSGLSMWAAVALGLDEDRRPVARRLVERNLLLGGEPGAGKSVTAQGILAHAAMSGDCDLILMDGKLVEAEPWRACASIMVGSSVAAGIEVLGRLQRELDEAYAGLAADGRMKLVTGSRLKLVFVDELALYTSVYGSKAERDEFGTRLRDVLARGRAAGIIVVLATQRPSSDIVPTSLRDLVGWRWALRCSTDAASDTILGSGNATAGVTARDIPSSDKCRGIGWLMSEEGTPLRVKSAWLSEADIRLCAAAGAALRSRPVVPLVSTPERAERVPVAA